MARLSNRLNIVISCLPSYGRSISLGLFFSFHISVFDLEICNGVVVSQQGVFLRSWWIDAPQFKKKNADGSSVVSVVAQRISFRIEGFLLIDWKMIYVSERKKEIGKIIMRDTAIGNRGRTSVKLKGGLMQKETEETLYPLSLGFVPRNTRHYWRCKAIGSSSFPSLIVSIPTEVSLPSLDPKALSLFRPIRPTKAFSIEKVCIYIAKIDRYTYKHTH